MSMRTTLSGCSIAKLQRAFGAADDNLIRAVEQRVGEELEDYLDDGDENEDGTPTQGRRMKDALAAIVLKLKGKQATLGDEGHAGYLAATTLRQHIDGEDRALTPFEVKHFFWLDLLDQHGEALGEDAELFGYLETGRPLFGNAINNECMYAWFTKDEAVRLREAAKRIAAADGDGEFAEVLTDPDEGLVSCIDQVLAAGYDLWAETT